MNPAMQRQYPGTYQQMPQRSPHHSSSRRSQAPMSVPHVSHSKQQPNQHQIQQQEQLKHDLEKEARAKRRSEKPTDKNIPEGIEDLIVGDGVQQYKKLRVVERKMDAVMMRKRLDQQDPLHNAVKRYSTLRIWISNTVENQPWQGSQIDENAFDFTMGVEATYRVKIEGRLIEEEEEDEKSDSDDEEERPAETDGMDTQHDGEGAAPAPSKKPPGSRQRTKLSHFFKAITVDFDRNKNLQPDGMTQVEWKKPQQAPGNPTLPNAADFDCLEFERKSDENINCTVNLYRDEVPERYQLSKELAAVLDTTEDDRASVIMGIWEYIKAMGIAQDDDKRMIQCDDRLKAIFQRDTIFFPHVPTLLMPHLKPLPPLSLPYTIRVDPEYHASPTQTIYTLRIPHATPSHSFTPNIQQLKQIAAYDDHVALLVQALGAAQRKHSFLDGYSKDPVSFTKRWMSSQKRDLEIVLGESGRYEGDMGFALGGEWRKGGRTGVWGSEQVREGVGLMVAKAPGGRPF